MKRAVILILFSDFFVHAVACADAPRDVATFTSAVAGLIKSHCLSCHGSDVKEAGLRLDTLRPDFSDSQTAAKWIEVMDNLNLGEMPPEDESQPSPELAAKVTGWIAAELRHA